MAVLGSQRDYIKRVCQQYESNLYKIHILVSAVLRLGLSLHFFLGLGFNVCRGIGIWEYGLHFIYDNQGRQEKLSAPLWSWHITSPTLSMSSVFHS